jgi:hypothetical protein
MRVLAAIVAVLAACAVTAVAAVPAGVVLDQPDSNNAIACPSATQCTAVGVDVSASSYVVREVTFNPRSPGHPSVAQLDTSGYRAAGLACPSVAQCTMVDSDGNAVTFDPVTGAVMASASITPTTVEAVACPATSECVAVGKGGRELTFNPMAPAAAPVQIEFGVLYGIACPATTLCVAVDEAGGEVTFDPAAPAAVAPTTIDPGNVSVAVTCPSSSQCTAIDDGRDGNTNAVTFNPSSPGATTVVTVKRGGYPGSAISCPTLTQCTEMLTLSAISTGEVTFDPQAPPARAPVVLSGSTFPGVVCLSAQSCTAVEYGVELTFDPLTVSPNWTIAKCRATYNAWLHTHRHTTGRQRSSEVAALHAEHGCATSGL